VWTRTRTRRLLTTGIDSMRETTIPYFAAPLAMPFVFWGPSIALHAIRTVDFGPLSVLAITVISPTFACAVFLALTMRLAKRRTAVLISLACVLAIWLSGPALMSVSASFTGGGFAQPGSVNRVAFATVLFPVFTLLLSVPDGSIIALLSTSVLLPAAALMLRRLEDLRGAS
jgi:hypothetical protein